MGKLVTPKRASSKPLRREGGVQGWVSDIALFYSSQNLDYRGSGTFYGIEKYRFLAENGRSEVGTYREMSRNV